MSDRELLEMAAKAAELNAWWGNGFQSDRLFVKPAKPDTNGLITGIEWNPLTDDGDALRIAVKLRIDICRPNDEYNSVCVWVDHLRDFIEEPHGTDPYAATRRAIVRAAAEIGKAMP